MKNFNYKITVAFSFFMLIMCVTHTSFSQTKEELPIAEHYAGGTDSLMSDINKMLVYPPNAKRNRIQGTAIIFITMEADGSFSTVKPVKKVGSGCDAEAIRVIKEIEKNGKFSRPGYKANYQIPITFKL